jgi:SpoIIAA-like
MIEHSLDEKNAILHLRPKSALQKTDFESITALVDPYIEKHGKLAGLVIEFDQFPGWQSFGALAAHLRFVRDHHKLVRRIGVVTDFVLAEVAPKLASHFVAAEIRHFPAGQAEAAKAWILGAT